MLRLSDLKISLLNTGASLGGPAMALDFSSGALDPRITFSRGTNATLVDSTGKITYAPANLLTFSEQFDNVIWTKQNATITANAAIAPDGTMTADKIVPTTANNYHSTRQGTTVTSSVGYSLYAKADGYSQIGIRESTTYGSSVVFNLANGTVSGTFGATLTITNPSIEAVGNGWYRLSFALSGAAASRGFGIYPTNGGWTSGDVEAYTYAGDGTSGILIWGAQLEQVTYQTTPGTYNATTASAYYGPRFDYDPVTLAPRGLLIEEARTNLLLRSDDFANAAWSVINATITANATASPDGTINADLVTYTGGASNGPRQLILASAGAKTYSFYVKNSSGARYFQILTDGSVQSFANYDIQTQTTGTVGTSVSAVSIINAGNGWYRLTMTATDAIATNVYIGLVASLTAGWSAGASSGAFFVYGAQLEAGAFATSYIPTVASTVSRSADVATMTGTNFSSWYNQSEGTFVVSFDALVSANTTAANVLSAWQSFNDINRIWMWNGAPGVVRNTVNSGGVNSSELTGATIVANTPFKAAATYRVNDYAFATNGGTVATDASGALPVGINLLGIGQRGDTQEFLNGHIRQIAYYNTRLPNTQLQTLTAPSLASPLALDFLSTSYTVGY
jgi:hypothetical protein